MNAKVLEAQRSLAAEHPQLLGGYHYQLTHADKEQLCTWLAETEDAALIIDLEAELTHREDLVEA